VASAGEGRALQFEPLFDAYLRPTTTAVAATPPSPPHPNYAHMLASILKEHQAKQAALKQVAATQHVQLHESIDQLGLALEQACDVLVAPVQSTQSEIERESQILSENAARFSRQTAKWAAVIGSFNEALKVICASARPSPMPALLPSVTAPQELGDFQNWSQVIECDMKSIHEALEFVKNVDKQKEDLL